MKAVVNSAIIDQWDGVQNTNQTLNNPSIERIRVIVRSMDGKERTLLSLKFSDRSLVFIGGGNADAFVVNLERDGHSFLMTNQRSISKDPVEVVCGGQAGMFPRNQVVSRSELDEQLDGLLNGAEVTEPFAWMSPS